MIHRRESPTWFTYTTTLTKYCEVGGAMKRDFFCSKKQRLRRKRGFSILNFSFSCPLAIKTETDMQYFANEIFFLEKLHLFGFTTTSFFWQIYLKAIKFLLNIKVRITLSRSTEYDTLTFNDSNPTATSSKKCSSQSMIKEMIN